MNFFRTCWQRRWFRNLFWTWGSLITLYALLCAWLNHYGARRWAESQALVTKEGEKLDFRAVAPASIPAEANFCAIELLQGIALGEGKKPGEIEAVTKRKRLEEAQLPTGKGAQASARPRRGMGAAMGKPMDLKAWASWLRTEGTWSVPDTGDDARDLLAAMAKLEPLFAELSAGLNREGAQWTPDWRTRELPALIFAVPMPVYGVTQHLTATLALRGVAAARIGDAAKAHESCLILLRLARASLQDPFLIGTLVSCAQAEQACSLVWELCNARCGSGEDFKRLERELLALDFRNGLLTAYRGEMAGVVSAFQWIKTARGSEVMGMLQDLDLARNRVAPFIINAVPSGWVDLNTATVVELEMNHMIKPLRDKGWSAVVESGRTLEGILKQRKEHLRMDSVFANIAIPAVSKISQKAVYVQCLVNQTIIACALEGHRIENGSYPDSLDVMKPADGKPLPLDAMNSKPMGYRKATDGKYALWSVGFDGKDDGGKRVLDEKKPENTKFSDAKYVGDWVWDYSGDKTP